MADPAAALAAVAHLFRRRKRVVPLRTAAVATAKPSSIGWKLPAWSGGGRSPFAEIAEPARRADVCQAPMRACCVRGRAELRLDLVSY